MVLLLKIWTNVSCGDGNQQSCLQPLSTYFMQPLRCMSMTICLARECLSLTQITSDDRNHIQPSRCPNMPKYATLNHNNCKINTKLVRPKVAFPSIPYAIPPTILAFGNDKLLPPAISASSDHYDAVISRPSQNTL